MTSSEETNCYNKVFSQRDYKIRKDKVLEYWLTMYPNLTSMMTSAPSANKIRKVLSLLISSAERLKSVTYQISLYPDKVRKIV